MMQNSQNLQDLKTEALAELAKRELARRHLRNFCAYTYENYLEGWHTRLICDLLERVERGEIRFAIIEAPPRHSKSLHVSQLFPAWVVGRDKDTDVIVASYSGDLATDHGRETRNLIDGQSYKNIFKTRLAEDSSAKGKWNTDGKGSYNAVGVGGSITGRGADFLIVDDPLKDRKEADSMVIREGIWKWFRSVARTRLSPTGAMVVMHCMTGDTLVLMADGTQKELREIKVGDVIATYENKKLTTSVVKNWANKGIDCVFTIKMKSGRIVRANERHPFLVNSKKQTQWIKVKDLRTGYQIVGVHGKELHVNLATNQQGQKDFASHITVSGGELMDKDHHQQMQSLTEMHTSSIGTGLHWKNIIRFWINKKVNVPYVDFLQFLVKMFRQIGKGNFVLTTAITQIGLGDSCAITATSLLEAKQHQNYSEKPLNTLKIEVDEIVEIFKSGYDDVFDIEVERTENFIANGLVSHNTRWHESDLIGKLTEGEDKEPWVDYFDYLKGDRAKWVRLTLPAIATHDDKYRKTGEPLWPERYSIDELNDIKTSLGPYEFGALYQGKPVDDSNRKFKKQWFHYRTMEEVNKMRTRKFATIDPNLKKSDDSDYCGVTRNYVNDRGQWNVRANRYRVDSNEVINLVFLLHDEGFEKIGIEEGAFSYVVEPFLKEEMRKRGKFPNVVPLKHGGRMKETRIEGLVPYYSNGQIFHIVGECDELEEEALAFPRGTHDDVIDSTSYQIGFCEKPAPVIIQRQSTKPKTNVAL